MKIRNETGVFMEKKRTVIKVGTSTLTYENGKINYRRVEQLCKVLGENAVQRLQNGDKYESQLQG